MVADRTVRTDCLTAAMLSTLCPRKNCNPRQCTIEM